MDLKIHRTSDGTKTYPLHRHKNIEIMLYLSGNGALRTERGDVPFCEGTVIIVPAGIEHGSDSKDGFKNISIEGDFKHSFYGDSILTLSDSTEREGTALANLIYTNRYGNPAYLDALCSAYVCFLLQRLDLEGAVERSVNTVVTKISKMAFDSEIDICEILRESGYAEDYIRSCFKKIIGKTPTELLTEIRIKHACYLIDIYKDSLSLSEIAELCGYTDYVYFSKKFKALTHTSPREYKKG